MSDPFYGEIRMFAGTFAPERWGLCDGQLLPISQNDALFSLLGTTYGGDGETTFGLPDLRGRVPVHVGTGRELSPRPLGQQGGTETETLTVSQLPAHTHDLPASANQGSSPNPVGKVFARPQAAAYADDVVTALHSASISSVGGGRSHENMMPYLCVSFIIALFGVTPTPI
jgi:microcystin-dependent protein